MVPGLCCCNSNAWGWQNNHQSGVIDITHQLILQNEKKALRSTGRTIMDRKHFRAPLLTPLTSLLQEQIDFANTLSTPYPPSTYFRQQPYSHTVLNHSLHVSKPSEYSLIHSTHPTLILFCSSTHLFIHNSIHSWHSTPTTLHLKNIHLPSLSTYLSALFIDLYK